MKIVYIIILLGFCGLVNSGLPIIAGVLGQLITRAAISAAVVAVPLVICTANHISNMVARINDEEEEKEKAKVCLINVGLLPKEHPNFIQVSEMLIPIKGFLLFGKNDRFEVDCIDSNLANRSYKFLNVICKGDNKYIVNGQTVDVSEFNKCEKRIKVKEVNVGVCSGGVLIDMVFKWSSILKSESFKLYSVCYDQTSSSAIYVHYKLYGIGFGELYFQPFA